jgi:hypothetical protein
MNAYNVLLLCHIICAVIWLGAAFLLQVQGALAARARNQAALRQAAADSGALAKTIFVPASLGALVFGFSLIYVGGWGFDQLWIVLGLVGFAVSFCNGLFMIKPMGMKIGAMIERDGMTPAAVAASRRLVAVTRTELVVLFLILSDMVLKPTIHDVALLAVMALLLIGLGTFFTVSARAGAGRAAVAAE